ncbi:MAG: hypothetical protein M1822_006491 [Bathelium mastoideum]|nr:MAG: hypothetical protein M1822_006491 [Bathelium mastoideum]
MSTPIRPHLEPSELGTKEYWDAAYTTELANHASNPADPGTIWFADSNAESKILSYLRSLTSPSPTPSSTTAATRTSSSPAATAKASTPALLDPATARILDLGSGNGHLLLALAEEGWRGGKVGVDYSAKAVALARRVAEAEGKGEIRFRVWDVVRGERPRTEEAGEEGEGEEVNGEKEEEEEEEEGGGEWIGDGFDLVLDKGTFDAVSLSEDRDGEGRSGCEEYRRRVQELVRKGGFVVVTSCNWTEEELRGWIEDEGLEYWGKVKYPSFTFGGVKGQTICTLCFRRTEDGI